jgi:hypothetical protein
MLKHHAHVLPPATDLTYRELVKSVSITAITDGLALNEDQPSVDGFEMIKRMTPM